MSPEAVQILVTAGRVLLGGLFVIGGLRHFFILPALTQAMAARRVPAPRLAVLAGSAFEAAAGLLLMAGVGVPLAAFGLAGFTLLASVLMLDFWNQQGEARAATINVWLSNIAIVGGLLIAAAQAS
jgi:putative oxidoreductase